MLEKTRGIVLHYLKFGETSIIAHMFTSDFGRKSFMIKGVRGRKTRLKANQIQPLFILNIEFYHKESRDLQLVKEFSPAVSFNHFPYDIKKSAQAMFMAEVLNKTIRQEERDPALFGFLENSLEYFDLHDAGSANFHLLFLIKLTRFLGILPLKKNSSAEDQIFDIKEGTFDSNVPFHFQFFDSDVAAMLSKLLDMNYQEGSSVALSRTERNALLEELLKFYSYHHYELGNLNSFNILKELFI